MFERFTYAARQVVVRAQESARARGSGQIESSDLLGGILLIPGDDPATILLRAGGLSAETLHQAGTPGPAGHLPFSVEAKRALTDSLRASLEAGHEVVAPLHLLIGALAARGSAASTRLRAHGVDADLITQQARTTLATATLPAAGPIALRDWRPPSGALPRRGTVFRTLTVVLLAYAACVFEGVRISGSPLGEVPLFAAAAVTPPVSLAVGAWRWRSVYDRLERNWRAVPQNDIPVPPELTTLFAAYGMAGVNVRREGPKVRSRCGRIGHRAYIVLADAHLNRPAALTFVLPHEVSHLLRHDARIRRLVAILLVTLFWLSVISGSVAAAALLTGGGLLLRAGTCWVSELACDASAARWGGRDGAAAWIDLQRTLHRAEPSTRVRVRRFALGWLTHPPLSLRAALLRV